MPIPMPLRVVLWFSGVNVNVNVNVDVNVNAAVTVTVVESGQGQLSYLYSVVGWLAQSSELGAWRWEVGGREVGGGRGALTYYPLRIA